MIHERPVKIYTLIILLFVLSLYPALGYTTTIVTFSQQGTYCYFEYLEKPETGLEQSFEDFFNTAPCNTHCGHLNATVNTEKNTISWDWEYCGTATKNYFEIWVLETNLGPPNQCLK